jgi:hypothetical protein
MTIAARGAAISGGARIARGIDAMAPERGAAFASERFAAHPGANFAKQSSSPHAQRVRHAAFRAAH